MKQTQYEKDNESYFDNEGYLISDAFFPRIAYKKAINRIITENKTFKDE